MKSDISEHAENRFDALRPYKDSEVPGVLKRLSHDDEFQAAIARYQLPRLDAWAPWLARALVGVSLRRKMRGVNTIGDFQVHIADYMRQMIDRTVDELIIEGLDELDPSKPRLFISNHRDISLDPAFVNLALHFKGRDTVRIAIGDNLLEKPFVSALMRLNKSFVVPRSSAGKREMLKAFQLLSEYIQYSIQHDNHSIWLAQRQGRAKNGIDRTDPGIIKMLSMAERSRQRDKPMAEIFAELNIVPVSISYEYDPCDINKARELEAAAEGREYRKQAFEDMRSIAAGITGQKGRVKVRFGTALDQHSFDSTDELVKEIDRQVLSGYQLFPSHYLALEMLGIHPQLLDMSGITEKHRQRFNARYAEVPEHLKNWWLHQYANPIINCKAPELLEAG
ncbi:1-acyl-sn-glycerol-3-phosphate acyltransferase [Carnimonas bestiolae]|uniref:1-acyl-sn-glycerol-3-phosphate acyltransferase n=1 Tax=Carnimonas bestiolae TaxID=3402172 RepID=UPI003EDC01E3